MKTSIATLAVVFTTLAVGPVSAVAQSSSAPARKPDVVFVPTPQTVVDAMLALAKVKRGEMVYDLGCGDGRVVVTAARDFGARGIGVDIDPERIAESIENAKEAGVTGRVQFREADLFEMDFSDADVLFLYLLPALNVKLRPRILDELKPGTRVVSHAFMMGEWAPDHSDEVDGASIYYWVVPAKVQGEWRVRLPGGDRGTLSLQQEYQNATGTLKTNTQSWPVEDARLEGATLTFTFGEGADVRHATAKVSGPRLNGTIRRGSGGREQSWSGELSR
jgi:SAM-dependent methyltransferase